MQQCAISAKDYEYVKIRQNIVELGRNVPLFQPLFQFVAVTNGLPVVYLGDNSCSMYLEISMVTEVIIDLTHVRLPSSRDLL